ncbi:MAG: hypothetical protein AABW56_05090, partial [Nanoarchaeota archaeon]
MKKQFIAALLVFLIVTMPFAYGQVTGTSETGISKDLSREDFIGEDILINVAEYQPKIVPQQAFETDDYSGYPVY